MPLISRTIEPQYLSRKSLFDEKGRSLVKDYELEAVANNTLSNVLRQLSSLVLVANDIFDDLARQLQNVYERSIKLKTIITQVEEKVVECDPKRITVPESDICSFSLRTIHFKSSQVVETRLFTAATRPHYLQKLYDSAAPTPIHTIRQLDRFRRDGARSSKFFVCTPVLSGRKKKYKKFDLEIETRKPLAVEDLRRWTSTEALGDITVLPDNTSKIASAGSMPGSEANDEIDHLLPSPEEQTMAVAMKFPSSIVAVDVSGRPFDRLSGMRRSLMTVESTAEGNLTRRRTKRRHRGKRRNTIAGTSQKEIEQAIAGESATETEGCDFEPLPPLRSKSTDLFKLPKTTLSPTDNLKNHFNTLKNWSKTKLKFINYKNSSMESCKPSFQETDVVDDIGIYETVVPSSSSWSKHKKEKDRKQSSSSSAISIPASTSSMATSLVVKLRENSLQRRYWRRGSNKGLDEPAHSSSGNWSASSESGRTSIASETTAPPKSSTTTSNNSLNHHQPLHNFHHHHHHAPPSVQSKRRYLNTSTSSSVSEGTLTPDINDVQFHDFLDGETSSVYSCDTEGYYTSFHMDSGLKTLKEEEASLSFSTLQLQEETGPSITTTFSNSSSSGASTVKTSQQLTAENEYELFGKGSTSTTTSSAGTVCTTLLAGNAYGSTRSLSQFAPAVPERKSSLERKSDKKSIGQIKEDNEIHLKPEDATGNNEVLDKTSVVELIHGSPSPDSGHNTSSSPAESESQKSNSPNEHLEFSESDLESCDRTERIRTKTAMTTCRIPSMCLITPPQSDDEVNLRYNKQVPCGVNCVPYESVVRQEIGFRKNQNVLNGQIIAESDASDQPLQIKIPEVVDLKKETSGIYAYPDKTKKLKTETLKTLSTNGVLETNIDSVDDGGKNLLHLVINGETGYAMIKTDLQKSNRSPSPSGGFVVVKDKKEISKPLQPALKPPLLPSTFMDKFKEVLEKQKKYGKKSQEDDYVTIAESEKISKTSNKHLTKAEIHSAEYVSLNELPEAKSSNDNPLAASVDNSLERKRQGARVTLDSEGKVVYSTESLKRKKQHTTFVPGKYVRESPTPSPVADKRITKIIRPVSITSPVRTKSSETAQKTREPASPQIEKLVIKAGSRSCDSPTKDFVRMPASRVVSAADFKKRIDRGARVTLEDLETKNRCGSTASSDASSLERRSKIDRCTSPSSSSSSSTEVKKSLTELNSEEGTKASSVISQHPAASNKHNQLIHSPNGFPRNHPMYWTLPARSVYTENNRKSMNDPAEDCPSRPSSHNTGAIKSFNGSCNQKQNLIEKENEFVSSTPSKEILQNFKSMNLGNGVSPILKDNLFNPKSKMSAEEIFAAIHKSKKKLHMKDDEKGRSESPQSSSSWSPDGSEKSLPNKSRERSSWSPNTYEDDLKANEARSRRSWIGSGTPINSFKKLLLQQGIKSSPSKESKISAVEQLKLSKREPNGCSNSNRKNIDNPGCNSGSFSVIKQEAKTPPRGILTRSRHQWRFAVHRTDVLSSTIPEDCSEVEKPEEDHAKAANQSEKSGSRFVRSEGSNRDNPHVGEGVREFRKEIEKPRENRSLEITKKYLQQARKNFFSESTSPNIPGVPVTKKEFSFTTNTSTGNKSFDSLLNPYRTLWSNSLTDCNKSGEKKIPVTSLETAL